MLIIFLPLLLIKTSVGLYDVDDSVLYKIDFPGPYKPPKQISEGGVPPTDGERENAFQLGMFGGQEDLQTIVMTSADKEQFRCTLPKDESNQKDNSETYDGPTVLGLLEKIFTQQSCAYRLENYWTYELCHGKHLRQYHEERDGQSIKTQEYFLGTFSKEMLDDLMAQQEKDEASGITRHPPTKRIEGLNLPYHEILMKDGTLCDLNQQPRQARVLYVCYPNGKNEIYSFKEVSTCEYEVVVLSHALCTHPSYKPKQSKEHSVNCYSLTGEARKPARLAQLELDSLKLRSESLLEAHMTGAKPGQVKIEIRPVTMETEGLQEEAGTGAETRWTAGNRQPFKPLMDPAVVKQFLKGEYCLYGGSGWWKYEFCYGKKVEQYHEESGKPRTVISLGSFQQADHLAWLAAHPKKRPMPVGSRKQVSLFYSGGDVCDKTGKPRQIEVKLKCKPADSPSTVSLYLLEPKVCEYVLGVESPLVCDLLPHADADTGLFPADIVDTIGQEDKMEDMKAKLDNMIFSETTSEKISSQIVKESFHMENGLKTTTKKIIVNGVVVRSETVQEKDGIKIQQAEVSEEAQDTDTDENDEAGNENVSNDEL